ncbi:MAG: undecaprenyl-diphosphate phosphatase [Candidatus Peribacteraceae bacterium]|nr:undecaprenyl-diphosphate phosphatase [Candidatus Peribacteraceae bacterium]
MTVLQSIFLGALQGLTEFLPISSSGHLVLAEHFLNIDFEGKSILGMNIIFHSGTLLALLIIYFKKWIQIIISPFLRNAQNKKLLALLILASLPAGVVGILYNEIISQRFSSVFSVSVSLLCTAIILWIAEYIGKRIPEKASTVNSALLMGVAQALALIPGLSRSGLTISAGRMMGVSRNNALDFSFLMACPVIAGATILTFMDISSENIMLPETGILLPGFISSFIVSLFAILFLRIFVKKYGLTLFSFYLSFIAVVLLFV